MSIASVSGRLKAERQARDPVPPVNSFSLPTWRKIVAAMAGHPIGLATKAECRLAVKKLLAQGKPFPARDVWQYEPTKEEGEAHGHRLIRCTRGFDIELVASETN